jgi:GNAT superfamily N-acetyltransferase
LSTSGPSDATAVVVRAAQGPDAAALAGLCTQLGYPAGADALAARLAALLGRDGHAVLLATAGERVLGWAHVLEQRFLESAPFAALVGLVVDAGARGHGVGARLVAACEAWAVARGLGELRLRSNVVREGAHRFYARLGFAEWKRQVCFRKALPAVVPAGTRPSPTARSTP